MQKAPPRPIKAPRVRYIKLGRGGKWEEECLQKGIIRLGYNTQDNFDIWSKEKWDEYAAYWIKRGKSQSVATSFTNQIKSFFEDDGDTLWVTFYNRLMWWSFMSPSPAEIHKDREGTFRKTKNGWHSTDITGRPLAVYSLSGRITKVAGYQGATCEIKESEFVLKKINAQSPSETIKGQQAYGDLAAAIEAMMRLLTPKDFELLADLTFTTSGWRRLSILGGTTKDIDAEMVLPSTQEKAFIQIKSKTNQKEFDGYYKAFENGSCDRMFYIYHSHSRTPIETTDERVSLIDAPRLSKMILDAGLASWLIEKAS